jgi:hypothetical protein
VKRVAAGIVMEVKQKSAIIMTSDGDFLNVRKPSSTIQVGEEITSAVIESTPAFNWRYAAAAAAIILLLLPFMYFRQAYATVAYVNVDINPSLEIGINKYNKVSTVYALNSDGEALLNTMSLKGLDINSAIGLVISEAKAKNFIRDDKLNDIEITLVKLKQSNVNTSEEAILKSARDKMDTLDVDATIEVREANERIREEAKKQNLSTNKFINKMDDSTKDKEKIKILNDKVEKKDQDPGNNQNPGNDKDNGGNKGNPGAGSNGSNKGGKGNLPPVSQNGNGQKSGDNGKPAIITPVVNKGGQASEKGNENSQNQNQNQNENEDNDNDK